MKERSGLCRHGMVDYSQIVQETFSKEPGLAQDKSLYFYSKELLSQRLRHLQEVFPFPTLHAVAIKSNSLSQVLEAIVQQGMGLEAASFEEVLMARAAGCPNDRIVFDSPAKTPWEIAQCAEHFPGMYLNANCFEELDRLQGITSLHIGVRINPLVDVKSPGIFDVSSRNSKFGIPIHLEERVVEKIMENPSISGLHVHAGSEMGDIKGHIEAIGKVYDLAERINQQHPRRIRFLDIGGGFPALMKAGKQPSLLPLAEALEVRCPGLFGHYQVITEFGRFVHAHNAFAISRVEYVLDYNEPPTLIIHLGADMFLREIYSHPAPYHGILALEANGSPKETEGQPYSIGGPLCFSGDFLSKETILPQVESGDWVLIQDCGANTLSLWSQHCSREKPRVVMWPA